MDPERYRCGVSSIRGITGRKERRIRDRRTALRSDRRRLEWDQPGPRCPDRAARGPRGPHGSRTRAYAYASVADLHSNCRTVRQTRRYDSESRGGNRQSFWRNEVPKRPQARRERSIIEKVRASYLIRFAVSATATASPMRLFNARKCTRYRGK